MAAPATTTDTLASAQGYAGGTLGFYGAAGTGIPTITGVATGALHNLLVALAAQGLIVDSTTLT